MYVCKDVCRNSGEIIKLQDVFLNEGGGQTLFCSTHDSSQDFSYELIYMHAVCWIFTVQTIDNILNKSGKKGLLSFFLSGDIHEGIYI